VLSFPTAEEFKGEHAGDLAVSLETAARQAREHGHSLRDEVRVLLLHGLLHLSGMDHEKDRGEMAAREAELRKTLRLKSGLIARVEGVSPIRKRAKAEAKKRVKA
jgi:probable rRNA maturation factor